MGGRPARERLVTGLSSSLRMNQRFKVVSLTHQQAPLAIRDLVALDEFACRALLLTLGQELGLTDVLVLSTCNRTEVYYSDIRDQSAAILDELARLKNLADSTLISAYFTRITSAPAAVRHLFEVALGLDAQVVGDQQICHQVKRAYQWAAEAGAAGPFLHRLLHTVFFAHKRMRQETGFFDGAALVAYAALQLVEDLTAHLPSPRVLLLGAGGFGADVARYFGASARFEQVTLCNRTRARADALAAAARQPPSGKPAGARAQALAAPLRRRWPDKRQVFGRLVSCAARGAEHIFAYCLAPFALSERTRSNSLFSCCFP